MKELTVTHGPISRGRTAVVKPGVLTIPAGATVGLIGANGAGKSSLMMAIAGVLSRTPRLDVAGVDTTKIGYLPQRPTFPPWLLVREVVTLYGYAPDAFVARFATCDIGTLMSRRVSHLSPGQQQLVGVLVVLALECPLLLLDEPLSALDLRRRRDILDLLDDNLRRTGTHRATVMFSSQVPADLQGVCNYFVVIRDGAYVFQGTLADLLPAASPLCDPGNAAVFEDRLLELIG